MFAQAQPVSVMSNQQQSKGRKAILEIISGIQLRQVVERLSKKK
jgi:hypothetical protein